MAESLNVELVFRMIAHWLSTKPNTYYGSTYGNPMEDMLQKPLSSPIADSFLAKMRQDIPVLDALPNGTINLYVEDDGLDERNIYIEVAGQALSVQDLREVSRGNY